jgi:hypothetical protein
MMLSVAALLVTAAPTSWCSAQDWQGNGQGYTPMPPVAPISPGNFNQPVVPGPPVERPAASRPASWPGGPPAQSSPWPQQASPNGTFPAGELKPCAGSRIIAHVGSEAILESDVVLRSFDKQGSVAEVIGAVDVVIEKNKNRIPPDQLETQRDLLLKKTLSSIMQDKLVYQDAKRTIPAEGLANFEKKLAEMFDTDEQPKLMKNAKVATAREYDQKLRTLGTSLEHEKRAFIERTLAREWAHQQVKPNDDNTYDQMVVFYYRDHLQEFTTPARAEWEELMVRYSKYPGNKAAAYGAIARMGNQVLGGAPFAQVAKAGSDGLTAANGGRWPWTSKGALTCRELDAALFGLPLGQLSPIISGEKGFHIIRVTRREDERVRPYLEAQVDIQQKMKQQRSQKQFREYMEKLEQRTPVWTIFDGDAANPQLANPPRQQPLRR